jgi:hypothetical protein
MVLKRPISAKHGFVVCSLHLLHALFMLCNTLRPGRSQNRGPHGFTLGGPLFLGMALSSSITLGVKASKMLFLSIPKGYYELQLSTTRVRRAFCKISRVGRKFKPILVGYLNLQHATHTGEGSIVPGFKAAETWSAGFVFLTKTPPPPPPSYISPF